MLKIRIMSFQHYNLNKFRNFIGTTEALEIEDSEQLIDFMAGVLDEFECDLCGMFAHSYSDMMYAVIKDGEEFTVYDLGESDYEFFATLDGMFGLHHYGLLIQNGDGTWSAINE